MQREEQPMSTYVHKEYKSSKTTPLTESTMALAHKNSFLFHVQPQVSLFPILNIDEAKKWNGEAYDAIVVCKRIADEAHIGPLRSATLDEINVAGRVVSELCKFASNTLLPDDIGEEEYNTHGGNSGFEKDDSSGCYGPTTCAQNPVPIEPTNAVFKISFAGVNERRCDGLHQAPCPMLLGFKSCQHRCEGQYDLHAGLDSMQFPDAKSETGSSLLRWPLLLQALRNPISQQPQSQVPSLSPTPTNHIWSEDDASDELDFDDHHQQTIFEPKIVPPGDAVQESAFALLLPPSSRQSQCITSISISARDTDDEYGRWSDIQSDCFASDVETSFTLQDDEEAAWDFHDNILEANVHTGSDDDDYEKYCGLKLSEAVTIPTNASNNATESVVELFGDNQVHHIASLESYMQYAHPAKTHDYSGFKIVEEESVVIPADVSINTTESAVELFGDNQVHCITSLESYMRYAHSVHPAKTHYSGFKIEEEPVAIPTDVSINTTESAAELLGDNQVHHITSLESYMRYRYAHPAKTHYSN